ncbi:peptidylglycine alpha-hydroxylating monooxygenase-like isoform X2 [Macrosteles quadrilineatus]|uniref:peptidylglycine alpha-hydroxylating monooxygenase-like isoform X2 n=1 Tax=Macrosteles quadrilineatus TaxID=74068 RepID=UPI0023E19DEC|nr:peptidylglycine alpha-hydroxylating monooxygenase-like isoform X2 [Macrosteles quadrilineatus]
MAPNVNHMFSLLIFTLVSVASLYGYKVEKYGLLMPDVHPNMPELYLCTPIRINFTTNYYIVGFEPNATMQTAHHMLLYGCTKPGSMKEVWNCGEMASSSENSAWETASVCASGSTILYAWAKDAPKLELPPEVGFKVGGHSAIQYLVLQVHYATVDKFKGGQMQMHKKHGHHNEMSTNSIPDGSTDDSGVFLYYTERPMSKLAGVYLLGTAGMIPPMSEEHMETSCVIKENKTIHPFAFRTHAHGLGKAVSGYLVTTDSQGQHHWTLIGKKSPQLPQMFYPVANTVTVSEGDILAARCTMVSNRKSITYTGPTNKDEMCNFYIMYYVEEGEPLDQKYCFSRGPPFYYWNSELNNIPDKDASTLD